MPSTNHEVLEGGRRRSHTPSGTSARTSVAAHSSCFHSSLQLKTRGPGAHVQASFESQHGKTTVAPLQIVVFWQCVSLKPMTDYITVLQEQWNVCRRTHVYIYICVCLIDFPLISHWTSLSSSRDVLRFSGYFCSADTQVATPIFLLPSSFALSLFLSLFFYRLVRWLFRYWTSERCSAAMCVCPWKSQGSTWIVLIALFDF